MDHIKERLIGVDDGDLDMIHRAGIHGGQSTRCKPISITTHSLRKTNALSLEGQYLNKVFNQQIQVVFPGFGPLTSLESRRDSVRRQAIVILTVQ